MFSLSLSLSLNLIIFLEIIFLLFKIVKLTFYFILFFHLFADLTF